MSVFLFFAPRVFPTLETKIGYTIYDLSKLKRNEIGQNSDSKRLLSIIVGWELFKENPLFGVGAGDLVPSVHNIYKERFPTVDKQSRLLPHNQFLRILNILRKIKLLIKF